MRDRKPIPRFLFHMLYRFYVPWDIGQVQPAIAELEKSGQISGRVLDVGCGWGATTLFLAEKGYHVQGIDLVPSAIEKARSKALKKGLRDLFFVHDVFSLNTQGEQYDTVLDVGLFHTLNDRDRCRFPAAISSVMRDQGKFFILCFSDLHNNYIGPRRISRDILRDTFSSGWEIQGISPTHYYARFPRKGAKAWLVSLRKVE